MPCGNCRACARSRWSKRKTRTITARPSHKFGGFEQVTPGTMTANEFDTATADLVGYLEWMAEPAQGTRKRLGVVGVAVPVAVRRC